MPANSGYHCALDVIHRIGNAAVLGLAVVIVIGNVGFRIDDYILQHGAKTDGIPYLRLIFLGQPDALGVTAALKIEYAVGAPAVFIVADEQALRISGKSGLAGAGEAEEQGGFAFPARIGRAMHGKDIALRQQEIHDAENRLLHLTCVAAAADDDELARKIYDDERFGTGAVALRVGMEFRGAEN